MTSPTTSGCTTCYAKVRVTAYKNLKNLQLVAEEQRDSTFPVVPPTRMRVQSVGKLQPGRSHHQAGKLHPSTSVISILFLYFRNFFTNTKLHFERSWKEIVKTYLILLCLELAVIVIKKCLITSSGFLGLNSKKLWLIY